MAGTGRSPSVQRIRNLILSLERLLAEGVASDAGRGAGSEVELVAAGTAALARR